MSLQLINRFKFFAVDDKSGAPPVVDLDSRELNKDKLYDLLGEDDETLVLEEGKDGKKETEVIPEEGEIRPDKTKKDDEGEEQEEEDDELKDLEDELKEPNEEQLELVTPVRRREILAKYPKLFQDFPYLEKAYYREQQFTELYPTINDAKVAHEKGQSFDRFESQLMRGNTEDILKAVKAESENSFHQIVDNYLTTLFNTDQQAYYHVLGNINRMTIGQMVQEGKKTGNDALISAAAVLQQYVFGTSEWTPPTRLARGQNTEKSTIDNERQQFLQQRYEIACDDLRTSLENVLKSTIEQNIDKQEIMTPYVKKAAVAEAYKMLQKAINEDSRFQSIQKKLWDASGQTNFDKASTDRIKSAFKSKAKTLLPAVLKKARNEALRGLGKRVKDDTKDENDGTTRSGRPSNQRNTSSSSNTGRNDTDKAKAIPKGMSSYEYLSKD